MKLQLVTLMFVGKKRCNINACSTQ